MPVDHMRENPWVQRHIDAEADYQAHFGRDRYRVARSLVALEYSDAPDPWPCPCGEGQLWWRATVGANICPTCGQMARYNGDLIGGARR